MIQKSTSLNYEPSSEPLHISAKQFGVRCEEVDTLSQGTAPMSTTLEGDRPLFEASVGTWKDRQNDSFEGRKMIHKGLLQPGLA